MIQKYVEKDRRNMWQKIKDHFKNLNNTQKALYLAIVIFIVLAETTFQALGVSENDGERVLSGIILVLALGIFLFRDK